MASLNLLKCPSLWVSVILAFLFAADFMTRGRVPTVNLFVKSSRVETAGKQGPNAL